MAEQSEVTDELFFVSHNESCESTIVLLHGLFSSHLEWQHVIPHLTNYHLLVPDQASHAQSKKIAPFTLSLAAEHVARLIRNHAHHAKAHLVGLSLGGFVTMELIRRHPDLVVDAFITGCSPFSPWQVWAARKPRLLHYGLWLAMNSGLYRIAEKTTGLHEHEALKADMVRNNTYELARDGYGTVLEFQDEQVRDVGTRDCRICVVAGDHGDNVERTKTMGEVWRELGVGEGKKSRAVVVKDAIHGWNLQFPELFADGIRAWIAKEDLPEKFVLL